MKSIPALLFLLFATSAFAQSAPPEEVSSPGCGDTGTKFDVSTDRSHHPLLKPDSGKALIYFLQDDSRFNSTPRPTTRYGVDGKWVGATQRDAYFAFAVDPGEHHLCAGWQNFVGFVPASAKSGAASFTAEAGNTYFFIVRNHFIQDHGNAHMTFDPVDSDQAKLLMTKFGVSTSHPKK